MSLTAIANQVDHHVVVEGHAIVECQPGDEQHRIRVVSIDVKDGCLDQLGDFCAVQRRTRLLRMTGGEADLVVDHHVDCSTCTIGGGLRQVQRFGDHSLADERRIAVDDYRQDQVGTIFVVPILAGAAAPLHDGRDHLQMRGVEGEREMDGTTGRLDIRIEALVILDVARAADGVVSQSSLKFGKQLAGCLAKQIDQDIEAAAMGHADYHIGDTTLAATLYDLVEQRDQ